ncbi:hypothetical protein ACWEPO_25975 [Streptomyces albidoflavus]
MSSIIPQASGSLQYRVTFDRIGRHGGQNGSPAPQPIVRSCDGDTLADNIAAYARRFLGSPFFEVVIDSEFDKGAIYAGMRPAGTFTIEQLGGAA